MRHMPSWSLKVPGKSPAWRWWRMVRLLTSQARAASEMVRVTAAALGCGLSAEPFAGAGGEDGSGGNS